MSPHGDDADPEPLRISAASTAADRVLLRVKLAEADAARRDFDAAPRAARNALSGDLSRAPRRWTDRSALHEAHRGGNRPRATLDDANLPEALQAPRDSARGCGSIV